jgi:hypothetical protein
MSTQESSPSHGFVLADAHVHFHRGFGRDAFLDGSLRNFRRGAADLGLAGPITTCLLLTESAGACFFRMLEEGRGDGEWSFTPTAEPESLVARRGDDRLILIAGRQVVAREGLEVLALATAEDFPEGLPLDQTLDRVRAAGALPVLPWGFGKWWFSRGARVARELAANRGELYLGDNAGRPAFAVDSRLFRAAAELGIPVLPGSDPLPLPDHAGRAGSCGFLLSGTLDEDRPARSLVQRVRRVRAAGGRLRPFGRRSGIVRFCRDQAALRLRRRDGGPISAALPASGGSSSR